MPKNKEGKRKEKPRLGDSLLYLQDWGFEKSTCAKCGLHSSEIDCFLMQCAKCKKAYYCSMQCFNDDLVEHQKYCDTGTLSLEPDRPGDLPEKTDEVAGKEKDETFNKTIPSTIQDSDSESDDDSTVFSRESECESLLGYESSSDESTLSEIRFSESEDDASINDSETETEFTSDEEDDDKVVSIQPTRNSENVDLQHIHLGRKDFGRPNRSDSALSLPKRSYDQSDERETDATNSEDTSFSKKEASCVDEHLCINEDEKEETSAKTEQKDFLQPARDREVEGYSEDDAERPEVTPKERETLECRNTPLEPRNAAIEYEKPDWSKKVPLRTTSIGKRLRDNQGSLGTLKTGHSSNAVKDNSGFCQRVPLRTTSRGQRLMTQGSVRNLGENKVTLQCVTEGNEGDGVNDDIAMEMPKQFTRKAPMREASNSIRRAPLRTTSRGQRLMTQGSVRNLRDNKVMMQSVTEGDEGDGDGVNDDIAMEIPKQFTRKPPMREASNSIRRPPLRTTSRGQRLMAQGSVRNLGAVMGLESMSNNIIEMQKQLTVEESEDESNKSEKDDVVMEMPKQFARAPMRTASNMNHGIRRAPMRATSNGRRLMNQGSIRNMQ